MKLSALVLLLVVMVVSWTGASAQGPVNIIFDTDMGNDVDDALALAMLHSFESRNEARILAITITKDNRWAAPYVDLVDTFYGRPDIPIGVVHNGVTPEANPMIQIPATRRRPDGSYVYPHSLTDGNQAPEAVKVLRRTLAAQPDGSVVIVQTGFSTNLARLLESRPDGESTLDGPTLVHRKVRLLCVMAGNFSRHEPEFNLDRDIPSAQSVFSEWPTPIVVSGYEIGLALPFPATSIEHDFNYIPDHPVAEAYRDYMKMPYDRPTWDLTAVLYAVRPNAGYFSLSSPGVITVLDDGSARFTPVANGKHRFLVLQDDQKLRTLETMILLASQPGTQCATTRRAGHLP